MYENMAPRIGKNKAIVAIARRMLVAVWHILTDETYDRHGNPEKIAAGIYRAAYKIGIEKIKAANPSLKSGRYYVDYHLRRMRMRHRVQRFKEGAKFVNLPA